MDTMRTEEYNVVTPLEKFTYDIKVYKQPLLSNMILTLNQYLYDLAAKVKVYRTRE